MVLRGRFLTQMLEAVVKCKDIRTLHDSSLDEGRNRRDEVLAFKKSQIKGETLKEYYIFTALC
jgi:hypothetical protein